MKSLDDILRSEINNVNASNKSSETLYNEALITEKDGRPQHRPSISVLQNGELIEVASGGEAIVIYGEEKSGKGITCSGVSVSWLTGEFGCFRTDVGDYKDVVIDHSDDTRPRLWELGIKISKWAGIENSFHKHLRILAIQMSDLMDKRIILEEALTKGKVGLVILDLLWDWIGSVNDESASKELTDYLLQLNRTHQFILIVVTHETRFSRLAKGHQGAHWSAKARTVLHVKKRGDKFIITPERCRGKEFDRIVFRYDGENMTFLDPSESATTGSHRAIDFSLTDDDTHLNILKPIFSERQKWETPDLRARLQEDYTKAVTRIGINAVKHLLGYYKHKGWLYTEKRKYHFRNGVEHA